MSSYRKEEPTLSTSQIVLGGTALALGGLAFWASKRYHVAQANQFLSKTGPFLGTRVNPITKAVEPITAEVSRRTFLLPFQRVQLHNLNTQNHKFTINNLFTKDRVKLKLSVCINFRPQDPDQNPEGALNYVKWISGESRQYGSGASADHLVLSALEGDIRSDLLQLPADKLLDDSAMFRTQVIQKAQERLNRYGLDVPIINVGNFEDEASSGQYLTKITEKSTATTTAAAAIAVAEAKKSEAEETNKRNQVKEASNRDYYIATQEYSKARDLKNLEVMQEVAERKLVMEQKLAEQRLQKDTAEQRATLMSKELIEYEKQIKQQQAQADSIRMLADAKLYEAQQEATGIAAKLEAEAQGLKKLMEAAPNDAMMYQMLNKGTLVELAKTQAAAVHGMEPKFNVYQIGDGSTGKDNNLFSPLRGIFGSLTPMVDIIRQQLNMGGAAAIAPSVPSSDVFDATTRK